MRHEEMIIGSVMCVRIGKPRAKIAYRHGFTVYVYGDNANPSCHWISPSLWSAFGQNENSDKNKEFEILENSFRYHNSDTILNGLKYYITKEDSKKIYYIRENERTKYQKNWYKKNVKK